MKFLQKITRRWLGLTLVTVGLMMIGTLKLTASVMVAPTVVFLSEKNRTGRIIIQNPADHPTEVTIRFSFGLPQSDSLGNVRVTLQDSAVTDPRSAMDWLRAFPRKVIIPAGGSQTVRLMARPPADLPDGEYWARIVVASQEARAATAATGENDRISTQLNMIMQMAIMVKYRTGELVSDLELTNVETLTTDSTVSVLLDMSSRGNVSYMGVINAWLRDANGDVITEVTSNLAVYRDLRRRIDLAVVEGDYRKPYSVEVLVTPDGRTDVPPEDLIKGNKIEYSANIE